jgi:hypothetical protein
MFPYSVFFFVQNHFVDLIATNFRPKKAPLCSKVHSKFKINLALKSNQKPNRKSREHAQ